MVNGFKKILQNIQPIKVLDVGGGGLEGENTSVYLIERYGESNVTHINTKADSVKVFMEKYPKAQMVIGDYYKYNFPEKFDLVVLDLTIERNLSDWEDAHARARELLKPGGKIITYVMTTTEYGDPETHFRIKASMEKVWGTTSISRATLVGNSTIEAVEEDNRRTYIQWVILK